VGATLLCGRGPNDPYDLRKLSQGAISSQVRATPADTQREMNVPSATTKSAALLLGVVLLLAACGVAGAQVLSEPSVSASRDLGTDAPPSQELAFTEETAETAALEPTTVPSPTTVTDILDVMLVGLGEIGYFGACPTVESTGLDPLSSSTPAALAEMTERHHCSWKVAEHEGGVTLNLDRLDVLGDEALYYVALVHDTSTGAWRVASASERTGLSSPQVSAAAVYIDDLLPSA